MTHLYYTPPPQKQFEELKEKAVQLWKTYDNTYGYVDEKLRQIKDLQNTDDNFMYIVAMFDSKNQSKLSAVLSTPTKHSIARRLVSGGDETQFKIFL